MSLRYYPVLPAPAEMKANIFAPGEYDEFRREDYASAAAVYEKLVSSADEATRIGALVRLGRVLRKANDPLSWTLSAFYSTAIFKTVLWISPLLTSGAWASCGKKMTNEPADTGVQLSGWSLKNSMSLSAS